MNSQARQQRRAYEKWLKKTDPVRYRTWKSEAPARGKQIHADNVEKIRQAESEMYEARQTKIIENLRNEGFSDSEIDEQEIVSFLNEYYLIYNSRLPKSEIY